jgi:site-specific DNA-adenine methylase
MYPGGKNTSYQKIINRIPPHKTYIEAFTGSGAVGFYKLPAEQNIFLDINEAVLLETKARFLAAASLNVAMLPGNYHFYCLDALYYLAETKLKKSTFVYVDPPYLMHTRKQQRPLYDFEMTDSQHEDLLKLLLGLDCYVMISGYWSEMYADTLRDWHTFSFQSMTRGGSMATEWLWMNYPEPVRLHDYRYLGEDFRQRERIKRKRQRWAAKLAGLDVLEQRAILWAMDEAGLL